MIYGKPKNVLKTGAKDRNAISLFNGYEAYQTLEKILNIHPKQTDLSTANFGKIILMNDADIDGGHIQALQGFIVLGLGKPMLMWMSLILN